MGCVNSKPEPLTGIPYSRKQQLREFEALKENKDYFENHSYTDSNTDDNEDSNLSETDSDNTGVEDTYTIKEQRALGAVVLGPKGSGKTTIFNQMRIGDGREFAPFELQQYSQTTWSSALRTMRALIDHCDDSMKSQQHDPEIRRAYISWMSGHAVNVTALKARGSSHRNSALLGPIDDVLLQHFAELFTEMDSTDRVIGSLISTGSNATQNLKSRAIRNAAKLLQCTDFSVTAFKKDRIDVLMPSHPVLETFADEQNSTDHRHQAGSASKSHSSSQQLEDIKNVYDFNWLKPTRHLRPNTSISKMLLATAVYLLWETCPKELVTFLKINEFKFGSNACYFLNNIGKFLDEKYQVSNEDVVHGRVKESNKQKVCMMVFNNKTLFLTDINDSRKNRKLAVEKADEHISCIMYVVNVCAYDQISEEFSKLTGLEEALLDFEDLTSNAWVRNKKFHLILNKVDLLYSKCQSSSFRECYPEYTGDDSNVVEILSFIEKMFHKRFAHRGERLYIYHTCATDMESMAEFPPKISDIMFSSR